MKTTEELNQLHDKVDKIADDLFEHCDCVVILMSITDDDKGESVTHTVCATKGNHHTRQGLAYDFFYQTVRSFSKYGEDIP